RQGSSVTPHMSVRLATCVIGLVMASSVGEARPKATREDAVHRRFGPVCRSAKDCGTRRECVPHYDITHAVVRRTCEYPCDTTEATGGPSRCPRTRVCVLF